MLNTNQTESERVIMQNPNQNKDRRESDLRKTGVFGSHFKQEAILISPLTKRDRRDRRSRESKRPKNQTAEKQEGTQ